jgi:hypothetical protein
MFDFMKMFQSIGQGNKPFGENPLQGLFEKKGQNGWGATVDNGGWVKSNAGDGSFAGLTQAGSDGFKGIGQSMQALGGAVGGGTGMPPPALANAGGQGLQQAMGNANQMAAFQGGNPAAAFNAGQATGGMPASNQNSAVMPGQGMERRTAFEDPRRRMMRRS